MSDESELPDAVPDVGDEIQYGHRDANGDLHGRVDGDTWTKSGIIRDLENGKPMNPGDVILMGQRSCDGSRFRVLEKWEVPGGPAKVNSRKYRDGWDAVFSDKSAN